VPGEVAFVSGDAVETADSDPTRRSPAATDRAITGRAQEEQGPVYSVRIKPLVNSIFADRREVPLTPGMAVTAEIKTGKRRVIGYLLDPVMRYWGEGLRER
jgi:multidrug efflux pump subunit AcrA (membrane-fusion protein)